MIIITVMIIMVMIILSSGEVSWISVSVLLHDFVDFQVIFVLLLAIFFHTGNERV